MTLISLRIGHAKTPRRFGAARYGLRGCRFVIGALFATGLIATNRPAAAFEPKWPTDPYQYAVVDQELATVLQEFGHNTGLRMEISTSVQGRVRGPLPVLSAHDFLDLVCRTYGLEWFFDGFRLYVTATKENTSRMLSRGPISLDRIDATLRELAILDDRFPLRTAEQADLLLVSGPPQYVALVERTLTALKASLKPKRQQPSIVTIYRGDKIDIVKLGDTDSPAP